MSGIAVTFKGKADPSNRPTGIHYLLGDQQRIDLAARENRLRADRLNGGGSIPYELRCLGAQPAPASSTNDHPGWQRR